MESAHSLAVKLNKLLKEAKILESCLFYKYLDNTTSFALVDPRKASDFHWDPRYASFLRPSSFWEDKEHGILFEGQDSLEQGEAGLSSLRHSLISISVVHL